jgi:hypothetical protein
VTGVKGGEEATGAANAPSTISYFADYVKNRDTANGWVQRVGEHHQLSDDPELRKEAVKTLMCRLMFGGSYRAWLREPLGSGTTRTPAGKPMHALLEVERELACLRRTVFASDEWSSFERMERARLRGLGHDDTKIDRKIFSTILQTIEDDILEIIITTLEREGWAATTLIFDGCHVLHNDDADLPAALREAERLVRVHTGFSIELMEKPLYGLHTTPINLTRLS